MDEHSENFNKKLENIEKNQSELKNKIIEIKNILGINSRLDDKEEWRQQSGRQSGGNYPV